MHVHMPFHLTVSAMTGCPQMLSIIKKYDTWDTLAIWPPFGLLDFAVEFEEGVANLFGTSYLRSHYCERGPLRQNMKQQSWNIMTTLDELHGHFHSYMACVKSWNTHIYIYLSIYIYTYMCTLFICVC